MKKFVAFMFCCGVLVAAGDVPAQNISIQNPSFENVPVPLGNNGFSALGTQTPGWTDVNNSGSPGVGVFNPLPAAQAGVLGTYVVFSNGSTGVGRQLLTDTLQEGVYTLSAQVGGQAEGTRARP